MTDFQIFDPYYSADRPHEDHYLSIEEYANMLYRKLQLSSHIDDFAKLHKIYDLLLIIKTIYQLQLYSPQEIQNNQKNLQKLIFQCNDVPIKELLENLQDLLEMAKSNTRSEVIVLLFSKVAPKSFSAKNLEDFHKKITPILEILPKLPEFEVTKLRHQLDRIAHVYQEHSPEADKEISRLIKKYQTG